MSETRPLTGPQRKMLGIVVARQDARSLTSARFIAKDMWPDSPAWSQRTRGRNGRNGAVGGTMPMKAATVLWRLHERGLVDYDDAWSAWSVTDKGRTVLSDPAATV